MRYIKATCHQCKTVVKFDLGGMSYEEGMKKISEVQAFECPGFHVFIAGIIDHYDFELVEEVKTEKSMMIDMYVDGRCTDESMSWEEAKTAVEEMRTFSGSQAGDVHDIELKITMEDKG